MKLSDEERERALNWHVITPDEVRAEYGKNGVMDNPVGIQATSNRFQFLGLADLLTLPPKEWLIDQILGAGDLVMFYGAPGSGKTFVLVDLIFSACTGIPFASRFAPTRTLTVAYCAGEGIGGLPARFAAAAQHYGVETLPNLFFSPIVPQLRNENSPDYLDIFVSEWKEKWDAGELPKLDVLVVDTFHSATVGADENSAQDMGKAIGSLRIARDTLGCAVILVHHTNKNGTAERGSSALRGAMDCMIECEAVAGKYSMTCSKLKDAPAWEPQTFDLTAMADSARIWWDAPSGAEEQDRRKSNTGKEILKALDKAIYKANAKALTAKQISEATGFKQQTINDVLARLVREELVERSQNERGTFVYEITEKGREHLLGGNSDSRYKA